MDWVDFKRNCAKYRKPYEELAEYCRFLLLHSVRMYADYRASSINGDSEHIYIRLFGQFLYCIAEMESLTVEYCGSNDPHSSYEWRMTGTALNLVEKYDQNKIDRKKFLGEIARWAKCYYGVAYSSRNFEESMIDHRKFMIEKNGF